MPRSNGLVEALGLDAVAANTTKTIAVTATVIAALAKLGDEGPFERGPGDSRWFLPIDSCGVEVPPSLARGTDQYPV